MLPSEKKRYNQPRLRRNANPMLNVEQFERYNYLKERVNLFTYGEYSEYIKLHTQFQDSIKDNGVSHETTSPIVLAFF